MKTTIPGKFYSLLLVILFGLGCKKEDKSPPLSIAVTNEQIALDPSGVAPLTATIHLETSSATSIRLRVIGKHGEVSDVVHQYPEFSSTHDLDILGLYAASDNQVELTFLDQGGAESGTKTYHISTDPLIADLPLIQIQKAQTEKMAPGMTLVSYYGYKDSITPHHPFIFDSWGDVRWYLDFSKTTELNKLFYDDGIERLKNGNLYFGDFASNQIYEYDMMGRQIHKWSIPGFQFHHQVLEKPDGNFLVCATKDGETTIEDQILEMDRNTGAITRIWDLRQSLDYDRITLTDNREDWVHVNGIAYDEENDEIAVSGRTQGVVKLDKDNHVKWILGNHKGWGIAGNGTDLNEFLLTPLDKNGNLITDPDVLNGITNHSDFEWNWYQHAPKWLPNGDLMVFDNGDNRNFTGYGPYSRAVEYKIDPVNKTVQQVWAYGRNNGSSTYSQIVSDVDFLPGQNHVIFSPGEIYNASQAYGQIQELDYQTQELLYDVRIRAPKAYYKITFHRTERLPLYPN